MPNDELTRTVLTWLADELHQAADNPPGIPDAHDHDEYHAAGAILQMIAGVPFDDQYIKRWVIGLRRQAGIRLEDELR